MTEPTTAANGTGRVRTLTDGRTRRAAGTGNSTNGATSERARSTRTAEPDRASDRVVPANHDLELALLGAVLSSTSARAWAAEAVPPEAIHAHDTRDLYQLVVTMHLAGQAVDPATVAEAGRRAGIGAAPDHPANLILNALDACPIATNVKAYAEPLIGLWRARQLIDLTAIYQTRAFAPDANPDELFAELHARITPLAAPATPRTITGTALADALTGLWDRTAGPRTARFGLGPLDELLEGGLNPGELTVIGGETGHGKSALALHAVSDTCTRAPVRLHTIEMGADDVAARILAIRHAIPLRTARTDTGGPVDRYRLAAGLQELPDLDVHIDDQPVTLTDIIAGTSAHHARTPLGLLVVDYAQLVTPIRGSGRDTNREQEVAEIGATLKLLGRQLNVAVLLLSQLNDTEAGKSPTPRSLRESKALGHHADNVALLYRPDPKKPWVDVLVPKQRNGPPGAVRGLAWRGSSAAFAVADRTRIERYHT